MTAQRAISPNSVPLRSPPPPPPPPLTLAGKEGYVPDSFCLCQLLFIYAALKSNWMSIIWKNARRSVADAGAISTIWPASLLNVAWRIDSSNTRWYLWIDPRARAPAITLWQREKRKLPLSSLPGHPSRHRLPCGAPCSSLLRHRSVIYLSISAFLIGAKTARWKARRAKERGLPTPLHTCSDWPSRRVSLFLALSHSNSRHLSSWRALIGGEAGSRPGWAESLRGCMGKSHDINKATWLSHGGGGAHVDTARRERQSSEPVAKPPSNKEENETHFLFVMECHN